MRGEGGWMIAQILFCLSPFCSVNLKYNRSLEKKLEEMQALKWFF